MASIMCRRSAAEPETGLSFTNPLIPHIEPIPRQKVFSESSCSPARDGNAGDADVAVKRERPDGHQDAVSQAEEKRAADRQQLQGSVPRSILHGPVVMRLPKQRTSPGCA